MSEIVDKLKSYFASPVSRTDDLDAHGYPRHRMVSGYVNMHTDDCPGCVAWAARMNAWAKENGHVG